MAVFGPDFSSARHNRSAQAISEPSLGAVIGIAMMLVALQLGLPVLVQFIYVFVWAAMQAAGGQTDPTTMAEMIADPEFLKNLSAWVFLTMIPTSILTAWLAYRAAGWWGGNRQHAIATDLPNLGWLGWATIVASFIVVVGLVAVLVRYLTGNMENIGEVEKTVLSLKTELWAYVLIPLAVGIFGPIAEEFIFRGALFSRLLATRLAVSGTILVTALSFALIHVTYFLQGFKEGLIALIPLFFIGLALGWLRARFGSIWVPVACHAAWNMLTVVLLLFTTITGASQ
jgi:uncharacterized protein